MSETAEHEPSWHTTTSPLRTFSTAVGAETHATGYGSTTVGNQAFSTGKYSVSIGSYVNSDNTGISATSSGDESVAVGFYSKSAGKDSTALGARSNASSASGTALGHYANTTVDNGVALGSKSQASREAGVQGYVPEGTELTDEQKNSSTWKSTMAEASVGSEVPDLPPIEYPVTDTFLPVPSRTTDSIIDFTCSAVDLEITCLTSVGSVSVIAPVSVLVIDFIIFGFIRTPLFATQEIAVII